MRCSRAPTCEPSRRPATSATARSPGGSSTGRCERCAAPRAGSSRRSTPTSEGEEGRFYTWTPAEARAALSGAGLEHAEAALLPYLGITAGGQLDGRSVLHLPHGIDSEPPAGYEAARAALLAVRDERVRPGLDDKRLSAWNALMIGALAEAGATLAEPRYLDAARDVRGFPPHDDA